MNGTEIESAPESVIVQWINTFADLTIETTRDLSDGVILFKVLSKVDPKWFRVGRSLDIGSNWVYKYNNLKRLYQLISRYFDEKLRATFSRLPQVDLNSIAKDADEDEIVQLSKYVLTITVQSPENTKYIQQITKLDKDCREQLLQFVNETMQYNQRKSVVGRKSVIQRDDDGMAQIQTLVSKISKGKQDLETQNIRLIDENSELIAKNESLENELQALQAQLAEKDAISAQTEEDIDRLKDELYRSEDIREQHETRLTEALRKVEELTRTNEDEDRQLVELQEQLNSREKELHQVEELLKRESAEADQFKTELDALHEKNEQLSNDNESLREEYKNLKDHVDTLENERQSENQNLETAHRTQIDELQSHNQELTEENNALRDEIDSQSKTIEDLEAELKEQAVQLQTQNQELLKTNDNLRYKLEQQLRKSTEEQMVKKRKRSDLEFDNNAEESNDDPAVLRHRIRELEQRIESFDEVLLSKGNTDDKNTQAVPLGQYEEVEIKAKRLEEQYKKQLHDISKLSLEKEVLQNDYRKQKDLLTEKVKLNDDLKSSLALIEEGNETTLTQQYAALKKREVNSQETQYFLKTKIEELKQYVVQQDKLLEEAIAEAKKPYHTEAVESLKSEIQIYETEIKRLKKQLEETRQQARREQQLMLSAWYDVSGRTGQEMHSM